MPIEEMVYLCTPTITEKEDAEINAIAAHFGTSREKAIRLAVQYFAEACVPTHSADTPPTNKNLK